MTTTAKSEWKHPLVVTEEALRKIETVIKRKVAEPEITISCVDNTEHTFSSVSALTKYENTRETRIESIRFRAVKKDDWSKQVRVSISSNSFRTLDIYVKGSYDSAPSIRDELEKICEGMKAWYWPIYKIDFVRVMFGTFFLLWLTANIWFRIKRGTMILQNTNADDTAGFLVAIGIIAIGSVIHLLRERIFPRFSVLIGQGIDRHNFIEKIQWAVIGLVVSLMVRLVGK